MIEQARAATRRAAAGGKDQSRPPGVPVPPLESELDDKPFGAAFGQKRKKDNGGSTLRTMALASGWACALTAAGYGAYALAVHDGASPPKPQIADLAETPTAAPPMTPNGEPKAQQAAVALTSAPSATSTASITPEPAAGPISAAATGSSTVATPTKTLSTQPSKQVAPTQTASVDAKANPTENARSLYDKAVRQVEAGDKAGLANLKRAANLGYAPAQFYLARLYDAGNGGVSKDIVEARRLTALAAQGGDPSAMYNYASYLYNGDGGAKDPTSAVVWFRKAAEQGIVNSQYNLAQLYETGHGVAQNLGEAYKWYLVAASAGDTQAKENADSLRRTLPANVRATEEAAAASLHMRATSGAHVASAAKSMSSQ
jgi:localization factor PodJL